MAIKAKEKSPKEMLVEEIKNLGMTHGMNTVFTNFLELTALALAIQMDPVNRAERQESYEKLEKSMDGETLSAYGKMTFHLFMAIQKYHSDPKDILGEVYTRLKLSNEWNGQFFTPDSISRMMAEILQIPEDIPEGKGYVTINEPTCGSGTMVYGAVWAMQKNGFDYQRKSLFVAQDIDIRCVWMTYIQCCLYRIPVVVIHGNTLTQEEWSYWYSLDALQVLAANVCSSQTDGRQPTGTCMNEQQKTTQQKGDLAV